MSSKLKSEFDFLVSFLHLQHHSLQLQAVRVFKL